MTTAARVGIIVGLLAGIWQAWRLLLPGGGVDLARFVSTVLGSVAFGWLVGRLIGRKK